MRLSPSYTVLATDGVFKNETQPLSYILGTIPKLVGGAEANYEENLKVVHFQTEI